MEKSKRCLLYGDVILHAEGVGVVSAGERNRTSNIEQWAFDLHIRVIMVAG